MKEKSKSQTTKYLFNSLGFFFHFSYKKLTTEKKVMEFKKKVFSEDEDEDQIL